MNIYKKAEPEYRTEAELPEERRERQDQIGKIIDPIRKQLDIYHNFRMRAQ